MIRLEVLATDVFLYETMDGSRYEACAVNLPPSIFKKYTLLRTADVNSRIEGVGIRMQDNLFYLHE